MADTKVEGIAYARGSREGALVPRAEIKNQKGET